MICTISDMCDYVFSVASGVVPPEEEPHRVYYADSVVVEYLDGKVEEVYLDSWAEFNDLVSEYKRRFASYQLSFSLSKGEFRVTMIERRA